LVYKQFHPEHSDVRVSPIHPGVTSMIFTTTLVAAVAGLLSIGTYEPNWQTSYRAALAQASEQRKPVAVFIAQGTNGAASVLQEGAFNADLAKLLKSETVPVYVNTGTAEGAALAVSFGMSRGVVISDRNGTVQAVRHDGPISQAQLASYLANPASTVVTTVTNVETPAVAPVPAIISGGGANGQCGIPVPSSCPNGRCPNVR
jgi:hypothetical protein